ncbi:MAG: S9 family peptidase [Flavobacteriaceae bacterium]|nr:S9 family peptidase [Flavobacteriaceae bacterium]
MQTQINPPKAKKIAKTLNIHNDIRTDDYYWLNDKDNSEVIDYLNAENTYCNTVMHHTEKLQTDLFEEMKSRIKKNDESVPYKFNGYWYVMKYEEGKDYPIYIRKKESLEADEELLFDCNEMAKPHSYFKMVGLSVSPDNTKVSFGVDIIGRRQYTLRVKCITTGEILEDKIENTTGGSTWANDNKTIFYTLKNPQTLRAEKIYKHTLDTAVSKDVLIYEEDDDTFGTTVYKSKSRKYIIISCYNTLTTEYRFLNANNPDGVFKVFQPRIRGLEYGIYHYEDHFYVLTNADNATNFKLMKTHENYTEKSNWIEVIGHRDNVLIEDIDIFKAFLIISERENGLNKIRVKSWDNTEEYYLPFDNETYTAYTTTNVDFDTTILRYTYNALTTPASVIDFDMITKSKTILKEQEVLGGKFDKTNYVSERLWAIANDGVKIPISLVRHKDTPKTSETPLLLYAYGSYGATIDPYFSSIRLSLLDRGFIYAIAHVRGGEYLGRHWYESGKLKLKKNTFTDFVACSKYLIENKYTSAMHHYAMGGSAGGLLMGVIANTNPELYNGIIAQVPFVDVVTTMLDESIPLTTGEYDEWGNPNNVDFYEYMKSYSPYDNVKNQDYPNMLITSGLHDSQVQYWEPSKWIAKLRQYNSSQNKLMMYTNMEAGHGGASGRFEALKEDALEYAFLLDLESNDN